VIQIFPAAAFLGGKSSFGGKMNISSGPLLAAIDPL